MSPLTPSPTAGPVAIGQVPPASIVTLANGSAAVVLQQCNGRTAVMFSNGDVQTRFFGEMVRIVRDSLPTMRTAIDVYITDAGLGKDGRPMPVENSSPGT